MLTKEQVLTIVSPHNDRILEVHEKALRHFTNKFSEDRYIFCKRTQANMLRDLLVNYAKVTFHDLQSEGITLIDRANGTFYIELDGKPHGIEGAVIARFKKVNKNLVTANIPTLSAKNFNNQEPFLKGIDWSGFVPANVNFAHLPNDLRTAYQGIFVTSPNGQKSIAWFSNLLDEAQAAQETARVLILPVETRIEEKKASRVTAKGAKDQAAKKRRTGEQ
jgi:hypothetical protein